MDIEHITLGVKSAIKGNHNTNDNNIVIGFLLYGRDGSV